MNTILWSLALSLVVSAPSTPDRAGGWATISVEKVPDKVVTGQPLDLVFVVKQHGVTPLSGLKPTLEVKGAGAVTRVEASPGKEKGQYKATVVLAQAGSYFITIHSGFGESRLTLPAISAVASITGTH
jgi:hypothetical protein